MDYSYKFPAVVGLQAGKEYYIAMIPLRMIEKLFGEEVEYVPPEYRAQRKLNESRIPIISRYITDNRDTYVFSALAATIDGAFEFSENKIIRKTGVLEISIDAKLLINDGQHRKAAIIDALREDETLGDETIAVVLYEDQGLARSQQMFTDLNKHAVKTSNSISELYDSRDELAVITRSVITQIPFLDEYVDKEGDIIGKYSSALFTLNTFYKANKRILKRNECNKQFENYLVFFWNTVVQNMDPWNEMVRKELPKKDLRELYVVTQSIIIQALGRVGAYLCGAEEKEIDLILSRLKRINWKRSSIEWKRRVMRKDGRIVNNESSITYAANYIKKCIGIKLTEDEIDMEYKL